MWGVWPFAGVRACACAGRRVRDPLPPFLFQEKCVKDSKYLVFNCFSCPYLFMVLRVRAGVCVAPCGPGPGQPELTYPTPPPHSHPPTRHPFLAAARKGCNQTGFWLCVSV